MWEQLRQRWDGIAPGQRKLITVLGLATVLTGGASLLVMRSRGAMTTLYTGLAPAETREIVAELSRQGIEYKVTNDETGLSVPLRLEAQARMRLASAGLPRSTPEKGWEIFGEGGLAVTKPQQRALQIRALQGELSRSIASLDSVSKAAVHISLKEDSPFLDQREPAKAAVLLHLKPGQHLSREQASAVAYLVARSVPDLQTAQVTIMDEKGNLLFSDNIARGSQASDGKGSLEQDIERRVQSQLDMTFGLGKTIARATAVLETERSELTKTTYKGPGEQGAGLPSKESTESEVMSGTGAGKAGGGVPGTEGLFGNTKGPGGATPGGNGAYKRDRTDRNYLVDEEKVVTVKPGGGLRRLTLGIFVDQALADSLADIKAVAASAAGIDPKTDSITVAAVKFAPSPTESFKATSRTEMIKSILRLLLNSLALLIGLLTLRSIISALRPAPELGGAFAGADGTLPGGDLPLLTDGTSHTAVEGVEEPRLLDAVIADPVEPEPLPVLPPPPTVDPVAAIESSPVDEIASVLRNWLEGDHHE